MLCTKVTCQYQHVFFAVSKVIYCTEMSKQLSYKNVSDESHFYLSSTVFLGLEFCVLPLSSYIGHVPINDPRRRIEIHLYENGGQLVALPCVYNYIMCPFFIDLIKILFLSFLFYRSHNILCTWIRGKPGILQVLLSLPSAGVRIALAIGAHQMDR